MSAQVYFGGLPTGPQIRKLEAHFTDMASLKGTTIPHEDIEKLIGENRKSNRYKTITMRWRKIVEAKTGIVVDGTGEAIGQGLRVLADGEQLTFGLRQKRGAKRKIRRWHSAVASTDEDKLTAEERKVRDHEMFSAGKIHAAITETRKRIEAPIQPEGQPSAKGLIQ